MKTFLRAGAFYKSEVKALSDDIDLDELLEIFSQKNITHTLKEETAVEQPLQSICNCQSEIAALNERIDVLTKVVNAPKKNDTTDKVVEKKVVKKSTAKKK